MATAFWKGAINFGMVVIPVKMYVATKKERPTLHYLHDKCHTRAKQVLYCPKDDEYFTSKETVRGYQYAKGQYVVVTDEELEKLPVKTAHTIDVSGFVDPREIPPLYYYDCHYLEPEDVAVRPYLLLREALRKTKRVGIAKVAFQRQEHLCSLQPMDDILVLNTLHYSYEVRPYKELAPENRELNPDEMKMAVSLIEEMSKDFEPKKYRDEYRVALEKLIEAKLKDEEFKVEEIPEPEAGGDIMAQLKKSIEAAQKEKAKAKSK